MANRNGTGCRQREMFRRSRKPSIDINPKHPLVVLADILDWTDLIEVAQGVRRKKLKNMAGRPPHLRALIGGVILMALRNLTYREAEDQIRHYGPARYLSGLTEAEWTPDFTTIQDFSQLMGEDGVRALNERAVQLATKMGFANPKVAVADTTVQEASIPHPTEMGLMSSFMKSVVKASQQAGGALKKASKMIAGTFSKAKKKIREYQLFEKSKEGKNRLIKEVKNLTEKVQKQLSNALENGERNKNRLTGYGRVAHQKVSKLYCTMKQLLPQIVSWLNTGKVARGKIISMFIPELRAIVLGKVGKKVEFGIMWGIERLEGGFILGRMKKPEESFHDTKYVLEAVENHKRLFGKAPISYGYDRGGHRKTIPSKLKNLGVKNVGLAPRGKARWRVSGKIKQKLISERAKIEGSIGTIKGRKYGFNRPGACSVEMMGFCGQRAVFGLNLNNLVRKMAKREGWVMEC